MESVNKNNDWYVWFDSEYTNLDLESAWPLQVAVLITDTSLRRVLPPDKDVKLKIRLPEDRKPSPWVEENLPDLLKACRSSETVDIEHADGMLASYVDLVVGTPAEKEGQRPILAGNSVHEDWWLVRRFFPRFHSRLNYRHLDVTTLKLEWKRLHKTDSFDKDDPENIGRFFPEAVMPGEGARHDAYYDIQASIAELAFYRSHLYRS